MKHAAKDGQHVPLTHGGTAQYQANYFCRAVKQIGISYEKIDAFARQVKFPKGQQRFPKIFFATRVKDAPYSHLKCFAQETQQAVDVLVLFFELILKPDGLLLDHGRCLQLMRVVIEIVWSQEHTKYKEKLKSVLLAHHDSFFALYGVRGSKPKKHEMFHLTDDKTCGLTCNKCERMHKPHKQVGQHGSGYSFHSNITRRAALMMLVGEECYNETYLVKPKDALHLVPSLVKLWPDIAVRTVKESKQIKCRFGSLYEGDMVLVVEGQSHIVGLVCSFASGLSLSSGITHFLIYKPCAKRADKMFMVGSVASGLTLVGNISGNMPYFDGGGLVYPLLPHYV